MARRCEGRLRGAGARRARLSRLSLNYAGWALSTSRAEASYFDAMRADPSHRAKIKAALEAEAATLGPAEIAATMEAHHV